MVLKFSAVFITAGFAILTAIAAMAGPKNAMDKNAKQVDIKNDSVESLNPKVLSELELEHSRTRDELSAIESRLNLLSKKIYNSELQVDYWGEVDKPFRLRRVELYLDGAPSYNKTFHGTPSVQALRLLDLFVPPGRHVVEIRVRVSGPDDADDSLPGYFSGSSISAHVRSGAVTKVMFRVEQNGDSPSAQDLRGNDFEGEWNTEINASSVTEKND